MIVETYNYQVLLFVIILVIYVKLKDGTQIDAVKITSMVGFNAGLFGNGCLE